MQKLEITMSQRTLGELLKSTRKLLGITQADAAKRAGVSTRLWAEVERGEREHVSLDTTIRLLGEMGIEMVLEAPTGARIGLTHGSAAERARLVRAEIRRATWTVRKIRLGDADEPPAAGPIAQRLAAVHEISRTAYEIARSDGAVVAHKASRQSSARGKRS